jgi:hypothetical protein
MENGKGNNRYIFGGSAMKSIERHVDDLFSELPESDRKTQLRNEIVQNLQEKVTDLMAAGKSEEDAVNKAIVEFGDIADIKAELMVQQPVKRNTAGLALGFSIWGALLISALVIFANLYYTPHTIWFVYPVFAVLWWPLAMFYHWLRKRQK